MGNFTNNVTVTSKENKTEVKGNETVEVVPVILNINKTANVTVVANNTIVGYTIEVSNAGSVDANDVVVIDELPDALDFVDAGFKSVDGVTIAYSTITLSNGHQAVRWNISRLDNETVAELYLTVRVNATQIGNLTNKVTATSKENRTPVNNTADIKVVPVILAINKTADVSVVGNNTLVEFTIVVNNTGVVNATGVCVRDELPSGFEFVNASEGYDGALWYIDSLAAGESVTLTIIGRSVEIGNWTNYADTSCSENNTLINDTFKVEVVPVILRVNKTSDVTVTIKDTYVTYRIVVANTGAVNATNVTVTDELPDNLEFINATGNLTVSEDKKTLTWIIPQLGNDPVELFVTVRTLELGNFTNTVTVTSNENNTPVKDNETITVVYANLTVVKSVNASSVSVGDLVEFTINVTNTGLVDITDITVSDALDLAFKIIGNESVTSDNEIIWNIERLNAGDSISLSVVVEILKEGTFNNTAAVESPYTNKTDSTVNVTAVKIPTHVSVENVTAYPGDDVTIQINVTSDDNKTISGNITVYLPDGSNQTVEIINGTGNITWHVPENYTSGVYNDTASYPGNDTYLPSCGNGTITVLQIPTSITVGNVTTFAGREVTIPINVTAQDSKPFNGNVTITLPDGSIKTVEIVNGTGKVNWFVPSDYRPDIYNDTVRFAGNNKYSPSEGNGTITVIKILVDITVGNITAKPGDSVSIPIQVIPRDGSLFNGNITVELPDGSIKVVEIIDNNGHVEWTIPLDYKGDYLVKAFSNETEVYYPANGTGIITVVAGNQTPVENDTVTPETAKGKLEQYKTANPIFALVMVLLTLAVSIKRRK